MTRGPFDPKFEDLPETLAVFPLQGVMVLPGMGVPLNIFEPRYLELIQDVLRQNRLFGLIGFQNPQDEESPPDANPDLARIGCCVRIVGFEETPDSRYHVHAAGLIRFNWSEECTAASAKYRQIIPDFSNWKEDLDPEALFASDRPEVNRDELLALVSAFISLQGLSADLDILKSGSDDEQFINALAMGCPFDTREKQALLEAQTVADRAELLSALLTMALSNGGLSGGASLN